MMRQRQTLLEASFPTVPEFAEISRILGAATIVSMLSLVWEAWDHVQREVLQNVDLSVADDQLERALNERLEAAMQERLTHAEPFTVQHESYEWETRQGGSARPPQYDIAFKLRAQPRIMWPLEGKVLPTAGQIAAYVRDIDESFIRCVYAPFTGEGAMLGYLREGAVDSAFDAIAGHFGFRALELHPSFPGRSHRYTVHSRQVPNGKQYPLELRCHHMLMELRSSQPSSP